MENKKIFQNNLEIKPVCLERYVYLEIGWQGTSAN